MNELILLFLLVVATGLGAGFLSGVLGVGGGVVIVPVLYYIFTRFGFAIDVSLPTAIGTSLATIMITQARSALGHRLRSAFNGVVWRSWSVPIIGGALTGGALAGFVSGKWLAFIFAIAIFLVAVVMIYRSMLDGFDKNENQQPRFSLSSPMRYPMAFLSGLFSAIAGIGGGTFNVSALTLLFGLNIRESIGTASALGALIGLCGALTFVLSGLGKASLIDYSLGYVNVPFALLITLFSVLAAPLGVALSHRIAQKQLQIFFALMLLLAASNMFYEGWTA